MNKRTKNTSTSAQQPTTRKKGRVVADTGQAAGAGETERPHDAGEDDNAGTGPVPDAEADQPSPAEALWAPVEPGDAAIAASANVEPLAEPKRAARARRDRGGPAATSTPETPAADDGTPKSNASRAPSRSSKSAAPTQPPAADMSTVAKRRSTKGASRTKSAAGSATPTDEPLAGENSEALPPAPAEPHSTLPTMEEVIAELAGMDVRQLVKRHLEMLGKAPRIKNRTWLQRKLAWFEQTKRYGGLSNAAKKRLDELMGEIQLPVPSSRTAKAEAPAPRSADDLPIGTRLERKWHDRLLVVTRIEGGWECEGATYRTLSGAAKAVSGSHCSGPAFFGLWKPKGGAR
jgi:hypothetical protein